MKAIFFAAFLFLASAGIAAAQTAIETPVVEMPAVPDIIVENQAQVSVLAHISSLKQVASARTDNCAAQESESECLCNSKELFLALKEATAGALAQHSAWKGKVVTYIAPGKEMGESTLDFTALAAMTPPVCASE